MAHHSQHADRQVAICLFALNNQGNQETRPKPKKALFAAFSSGMLFATKMPLRSIIYDTWLVGIGVQVLLFAALLTKKIWHKFPAFFAYVAFNLFEAAITYAVFHKGIVYFYTFWICEAIGILLTLGAVWEVFTSLFLPHPALRKLTQLIFRGTVVLLIGLAVGVIYLQSGEARGIPSAVLLAAEAARMVEVGLIMFLFLSSSAFGLRWRQSTFGIALGLGMYAAVELAIVALMTHVSSTAGEWLSLIGGLAFNFSLFIWLGYFLMPEERAVSSAEIPKRAQLEQWNQAVMELISR